MSSRDLHSQCIAGIDLLAKCSFCLDVGKKMATRPEQTIKEMDSSVIIPPHSEALVLTNTTQDGEVYVESSNDFVLSGYYTASEGKVPLILFNPTESEQTVNLNEQIGETN